MIRIDRLRQLVEAALGESVQSIVNLGLNPEVAKIAFRMIKSKHKVTILRWIKDDLGWSGLKDIAPNPTEKYVYESLLHVLERKIGYAMRDEEDYGSLWVSFPKPGEVASDLFEGKYDKLPLKQFFHLEVFLHKLLAGEIGGKDRWKSYKKEATVGRYQWHSVGGTRDNKLGVHFKNCGDAHTMVIEPQKALDLYFVTDGETGKALGMCLLYEDRGTLSLGFFEGRAGSKPKRELNGPYLGLKISLEKRFGKKITAYMPEWG